MNILIKPYETTFQSEVIELILSIQQQEFGVAITAEDQPDLYEIEKVYQTGRGNFWVAQHNGQVVGTISLVDIGDGMVALKKMFVNKDFRGEPYRVGQELLNVALQWAKKHEVTSIYLGTTPQFKAAHRFYEKNGFVQIPETILPASFPIVAVDKLFYRYEFT